MGRDWDEGDKEEGGRETSIKLSTIKYIHLKVKIDESCKMN